MGHGSSHPHPSVTLFAPFFCLALCAGMNLRFKGNDRNLLLTPSPQTRYAEKRCLDPVHGLALLSIPH
jgi:hypothetical protein